MIIDNDSLCSIKYSVNFHDSFNFSTGGKTSKIYYLLAQILAVYPPVEKLGESQTPAVQLYLRKDICRGQLQLRYGAINYESREHLISAVIQYNTFLEETLEQRQRRDRYNSLGFCARIKCC